MPRKNNRWTRRKIRERHNYRPVAVVKPSAPSPSDRSFVWAADTEEESGCEGDRRPTPAPERPQEPPAVDTGRPTRLHKTLATCRIENALLRPAAAHWRHAKASTRQNSPEAPAGLDGAPVRRGRSASRRDEKSIFGKPAPDPEPTPGHENPPERLDIPPARRGSRPPRRRARYPMHLAVAPERRGQIPDNRTDAEHRPPGSEDPPAAWGRDEAPGRRDEARSREEPEPDSDGGFDDAIGTWEGGLSPYPVTEAVQLDGWQYVWPSVQIGLTTGGAVDVHMYIPTRAVTPLFHRLLSAHNVLHYYGSPQGVALGDVLTNLEAMSVPTESITGGPWPSHKTASIALTLFFHPHILGRWETYAETMPDVRRLLDIIADMLLIHTIKGLYKDPYSSRPRLIYDTFSIRFIDRPVAEVATTSAPPSSSLGYTLSRISPLSSLLGGGGGASSSRS